jgi:hypothetical protein
VLLAGDHRHCCDGDDADQRPAAMRPRRRRRRLWGFRLLRFENPGRGRRGTPPAVDAFLATVARDHCFLLRFGRL